MNFPSELNILNSNKFSSKFCSNIIRCLSFSNNWTWRFHATGNSCLSQTFTSSKYNNEKIRKKTWSRLGRFFFLFCHNKCRHAFLAFASFFSHFKFSFWLWQPVFLERERKRKRLPHEDHRHDKNFSIPRIVQITWTPFKWLLFSTYLTCIVQ